MEDAELNRLAALHAKIVRNFYNGILKELNELDEVLVSSVLHALSIMLFMQSVGNRSVATGTSFEDQKTESLELFKKLVRSTKEDGSYERGY